MPDGPPLGRLTGKESATQALLGENFADSENFLNGTATMHPYFFSFFTNSGKCAEFKNKRSCNQARPCAWNSTSCNFIEESRVLMEIMNSSFSSTTSRSWFWIKRSLTLRR